MTWEINRVISKLIDNLNSTIKMLIVPNNQDFIVTRPSQRTDWKLANETSFWCSPDILQRYINLFIYEAGPLPQLFLSLSSNKWRQNRVLLLFLPIKYFLSFPYAYVYMMIMIMTCYHYRSMLFYHIFFQYALFPQYKYDLSTIVHQICSMAQRNAC